MDTIKICFVGIGSIAKRHVRNIRKIFDKTDINVSIDALRSCNEPVEGVNTIYTSMNNVPSDYDAVFITNPTEKHLQTLVSFTNKGRHFFIEKPAVSVGQIKEARKTLLKPDSVYYVACPLRYNSVIRYIKENVDPKSVYSVRSISSSYLPDWRPGQDYTKTYSAHRKLGGGVSIDLIHEWDYLTYLFGWPQKVCSIIGKKSDLDIDSDDLAVYIAEYPDKTAELHLDYFGRKTVREIELFTKEDTVTGDLVNNRITFLKSGKTIDFKEERDDYQIRELKRFFDMITGNAQKEDGFGHGLKVLELTQGII